MLRQPPGDAPLAREIPSTREFELSAVPELGDLVALVARLRAPDGCPWDRKQTLQSVRAYLIEEAHELAAAIDSGDPRLICEELGDLLFQTAFIARLADEAGDFNAVAAVEGIVHKMVARHPHVFGDAAPLDSEDAVLAAWEAGKEAERGPGSVLSGVPASLPALTGAYRLTQKAAGVGFDWPDVAGIVAKIKEELEEVEEVLCQQDAADRGPGSIDRARLEEHLAEEVGDLLFSVANLARRLKIDPEGALARGNLKFRRRFQALEAVFEERGQPLADQGLAAMDEVWEGIKEGERRDRGVSRDPGSRSKVEEPKPADP